MGIRTNKPLFIGLSIGLVLFILLVMLSPKPIDWSLSFSKKDKIPFGNSILYELLPTLFPAGEIVDSHTPLIKFINNVHIENTNYIIITDQFSTDSIENETILSTVSEGNNVFIAAHQFSGYLNRKFNIKLKEMPFRNIISGDSTILNFANKKLKAPFGYSFKRIINNTYFSSYDSTSTTVLGYNNKGQTTYIRIKYGNGNLFLSTTPLAFCNYSLLKNNNYEYIFKSLSYLPKQHTIWDEYYKPTNMQGRSKMEFILKNSSLRYAWYFLLAGIIIYFVFEGKRRQRVIPVVIPPENTTLKFIDTIGRLYFNRRNHLDLARKKFMYFTEYIRTKYYLNIIGLSNEGFNELVAKSGVPSRTIIQIIEMGNSLQKMTSLTEEDLVRFNQQIEFFYQHSK